MSLFRNKRFILDEIFQENASKYAVFLEYDISSRKFYFRVSFDTTIEPLMNVKYGKF